MKLTRVWVKNKKMEVLKNEKMFGMVSRSRYGSI